jgi:zinc transporter 9
MRRRLDGLRTSSHRQGGAIFDGRSVVLGGPSRRRRPLEHNLRPSQIRWCAAGSSSSSSDKKNDDEKNEDPTPDDGDFERYLTGEMATPVAPRRPKRTRRLLPNPDKELIVRIRKEQMRQKEKSRLRTARNVNRALMGNVIICAAKLGAWVSSGSSAMLSELIHSVVDCGNQALLLVGLRDSRLVADGTHPYGYGKSVYFWALVSALGTFFLGAGVSMTHAIGDVLQPSLQEITWHVWSVLLLSLVVDGYVLYQTYQEIMASKPAGVPFWKHFNNLRDPATLAILLEDGAACLGVLLASGGIVLTHLSGNPVFDGLAGVGISALLGGMGVVLVRVNHRFLLGQAVDPEIVGDINKILLSRRSIDSIGSVQSQWTGPETFSYKAEVDFDGTYLAATLMNFYQQEFIEIRDSMEDELQGTLAGDSRA